MVTTRLQESTMQSTPDDTSSKAGASGILNQHGTENHFTPPEHFVPDSYIIQFCYSLVIHYTDRPSRAILETLHRTRVQVPLPHGGVDDRVIDVLRGWLV